MPQAQDALAYVYEGAWTDRSKGSFSGALTLTLSAQNSSILVAALALFVSAVGSQLWNILRFLIHQYRATVIPQVGLHHQQQALLRNSDTGPGFLLGLISLHTRWRRRLRQSLGSLVLLSSCTLIYLAAITALGLLASRIVKAGDKVLINSPFCAINGYPDGYYDDSNQTQRLARQLNYAADLQAGTQYARDCYDTVNTSRATCGTFPVPKIQFDMTQDVGCPFDQSICHPNASAVRFDTGLVDSITQLGINSKPQDRNYVRKVTTCVPLNDAAHVVVNNELSPNRLNITDAFYGPQTGRGGNATYSTTDVFFDMTSDQKMVTRVYELEDMFTQQLSSSPNAVTESTFDPISELVLTDSDLYLFFMTYAGFYQTPVDDPWFSAHTGINVTFTTFSNPPDIEEVVVYVKDRPISTMGCTEQFQVCASNLSTCTALQGMQQVINEVQTWEITDFQSASMGLILTSFLKSTLNHIVLEDGGNVPLLANDLVYVATSPSLPNNQWLVETKYWFSISLAMLQLDMLAMGTGQDATDTWWINTTLSSVEKTVCKNFVIRGTDFQSFDLAFIIGFLVAGLFVVAVSFSIERLTGQVQERYSKGLTRKEMWETDDVLQLQRLLYEAYGQGTWSSRTGAVPITDTDELLTALRMHGNSHARDSTSNPFLAPSSDILDVSADTEKLDSKVGITPLTLMEESTNAHRFPSLIRRDPGPKEVRRKPLPTRTNILQSRAWEYQSMSSDYET